LNPDLCLATKDGNPKAAIDRLESLKIPVYVVNPDNLDTILETILEIGAILGAGHLFIYGERHRQLLRPDRFCRPGNAASAATYTGTGPPGSGSGQYPGRRRLSGDLRPTGKNTAPAGGDARRGDHGPNRCAPFYHHRP